MKIFRQLVVFGMLLVIVFVSVGCGQVTQDDQSDLVPVVPDNFVYTPAEHGESDELFVDSGLSVEFHGIDLQSDNLLDGVDTLEYWSAVYDLDGVVKYVTRVRLRGLLTGCPDIRYDDESDGYALLATEQGVWVREAGSKKFISDESDYETWLFEEEIYLSAISRWDGLGDLFTPSSPVSGSLVLLCGIVPGADLDNTLFKVKGE